MRDDDIDQILQQSSRATPAVDPALLDRISGSMRDSLRPVRPLPSTFLLIVGLVAVCAGLGVVGAMALGPHGVMKMNAMEIAVIFPALLLLICVAANRSVSEMIPGSRLIAPRWVLPAMVSLALVAVFAVLFHDYGVERFVPQGMTCLKAGLLQAVPAAIAVWWVLHRGFAIDSAGAGLAMGTLAGLAGVCMLELHCANFEAPHVMVWHTAVVPLSGVAGAVVMRMRSRQ